MKRIIPLYLIRELLPPFFVNLLVFTFVLLLAKVLELTELVVVKGVEPATIMKLLGYSIPFLLSLTIPMSTLLAVLLTFLRLSGDNEITVLKSAGVSLYKLLPPVILFCLWTYLLTSYLAITVVPGANQAFRNELLALAKARADISIKERVFNEDFKKMVLYVNHMPLGSDRMENIFIQDERDAEMVNVILASNGRIVTDPKQRVLIFQLFDGLIDRVDRQLTSTETINFESYDLKLNLESELAKERLKAPDQYEMNLDELWTAIEGFKKKKDMTSVFLYEMEAHKRFSLPFACLVLGLVAVPFGAQSRMKGRNWGITMGLGLFLVYYLLLSAGWSFGESGDYPPVLGMWAPNILVGAVAVYMLRQANRETSIGILSLVDRILSWFRSGQENPKP